MGEYADMAVDEALNGYWGDPDIDPEDSDWAPYGRRHFRRQRKKTNAEIFAKFTKHEIDYSQF